MKSSPKYISFLKENRTKKQAVEIYDQRIKDSSDVYERFSADFYTRDCPVCGSDHHYDEEKFNGQYGVVTCYKCKSMFVNPTPSMEALDYYYNNSECNKLLGNLYNQRGAKFGYFAVSA